MKHLIALLSVVVIVACQPVTTPPTVAPPPTSTATASGIDGRVVSVSDVATIPDVAYADADVVVLPLSAVPSNADLPFLNLNVSPQMAVASTTTDVAGVYHVDLDPGQYVVCLAAGGLTFGCVQASVAQGRTLLSIGQGEGGVYPYQH